MKKKDKEFLSAISLNLKHAIKPHLKRRELVTLRDAVGNTPLHVAAKHDDVQLIKLLISRRFPLSARNTIRQKQVPVHIAARKGCLQVIEYLHKEESVDMGVTDNYNRNALHYAIEGGKLEVVKYLIQVAGVNPKKRDRKTGNNPLQLACRTGDLQIVRYLAGNVKLNPYTSNLQGQNCLHLAVLSGNLQLVQFLQSKFDINPLEADNQGLSAVAMSVQKKSTFDIFQYFLKHVSIEAIVYGDPLVTRSLTNAPPSVLQIAENSGNSDAVFAIKEK